MTPQPKEPTAEQKVKTLETVLSDLGWECRWRKSGLLIVPQNTPIDAAALNPPKEPTPETLRALDEDLNDILEGESDGVSGTAIAFLRLSVAAHAAAWEADRQARHTAEVAAEVYRNSDQALRLRLLEVERAAKELADEMDRTGRVSARGTMFVWTDVVAGWAYRLRRLVGGVP